ncbi:hypothetical protein SARC_06728 [Sphaeroforma arctica JP610]|uniref:Uncharacterized protein n=1 Tax=Sphaeroforma arctica JP610 TaxID=667725 RepID=A0A0L0FVR3_9EUKA|nr:hypothetical protein SARC_06728 [Sphaeroforma arctica JP610]KNC80940.1 hypothetical protein SARC_06728 [Sphaeroforma arctica JP610]|eukprot:XP_014154842.1 hypothetical protein SARC_06728 [Sphaeroforma arctica JP610]
MEFKKFSGHRWEIFTQHRTETVAKVKELRTFANVNGKDEKLLARARCLMENAYAQQIQNNALVMLVGRAGLDVTRYMGLPFEGVAEMGTVAPLGVLKAPVQMKSWHERFLQPVLRMLLVGSLTMKTGVLVGHDTMVKDGLNLMLNSKWRSDGLFATRGNETLVGIESRVAKDAGVGQAGNCVDTKTRTAGDGVGPKASSVES